MAQRLEYDQNYGIYDKDNGSYVYYSEYIEEIAELVYELKLAREMSNELPKTAGLMTTQKAWDKIIKKHRKEG